MSEHCAICGCLLHRGSNYAKPTIKGRSHATKHHYVAERFFGRSKNRPNTQRKAIFNKCPWNIENKTVVLCYECHEELIHNVVFLPGDIEDFCTLVKSAKLDETRKTGDRSKIGGRIKLLQEVVTAGLQAMLTDAKR